MAARRTADLCCTDCEGGVANEDDHPLASLAQSVEQWPGDGRQVFSKGIFVGYRYF